MTRVFGGYCVMLLALALLEYFIDGKVTMGSNTPIIVAVLVGASCIVDTLLEIKNTLVQPEVSQPTERLL